MEVFWMWPNNVSIWWNFEELQLQGATGGYGKSNGWHAFSFFQLLFSLAFQFISILWVYEIFKNIIPFPWSLYIMCYRRNRDFRHEVRLGLSLDWPRLSEGEGLLGYSIVPPWPDGTIGGWKNEWKVFRTNMFYLYKTKESGIRTNCWIWQMHLKKTFTPQLTAESLYKTLQESRNGQMNRTRLQYSIVTDHPYVSCFWLCTFVFAMK